MTNYLLAFSDACPQESIDTEAFQQWHTFAAVSWRLEHSPLASKLVIPTRGGFGAALSIPDPLALEKLLRTDERQPFRDWKSYRGAERKSAALERLLQACTEGRANFFSHSTLSQYAGPIVDGCFGPPRTSLISRPGLVGRPEYEVRFASGGPPVPLSWRDFVSLGWLARCCWLLYRKAAETLGNVELLIIHDNLPLNRDRDVAIVQQLLAAAVPGKVHFMTAGKTLGFAPADNFAAAAQGLVAGTGGAMAQWAVANARPKNVYVMADEPDGTPFRYL